MTESTQTENTPTTSNNSLEEFAKALLEEKNKLRELKSLDNYETVRFWLLDAHEGFKKNGWEDLLTNGDEMEAIKKKENPTDEEKKKIIKNEKGLRYLKGGMGDEVAKTYAGIDVTQTLFEAITETCDFLRGTVSKKSFKDFEELKFKIGDNIPAFLIMFKRGNKVVFGRESTDLDVDTFMRKIPTKLQGELRSVAGKVKYGAAPFTDLFGEFKVVAQMAEEETNETNVNHVNFMTKEKFMYECNRCKTDSHSYKQCPKFKCMNCQELGHGWRRCKIPFTKEFQNFVSGSKKVSFITSSLISSDHKQKQNTHLETYNSKNIVSDKLFDNERNKEIRDEVIKPKNDFSYQKLESVNSVIGGEEISQKWIIDSGATVHTCNDVSMLRNHRDERTAIKVATGEVVMGTKRGDIFLRQKSRKTILKLTNVVYSADIKKNIISTRALGDEYKTTFNGKTAIIEQKSEMGPGKVVIHIDNGDLLYQTYLEEVNIAEMIKDPDLEWHKRLGHAGALRLEKTLGSEIQKSDNRCEACMYCKLKNKPFKKSLTRCTELLERLHIDIAGPINLESPNQSRFVLFVVDEYSRWTEIAIIEKKSDALSRLVEIITRWSNLHNKTVKILRSDNASEFLSREFNEQMSMRGITREKSVPYNPEQNGLAERTIGIVKETAAVLRKDKNLPEWTWQWAMKHAVLLKNITYSTAIKQIPYEVWTEKTFDYNRLKIFGSVAYGHIPLKLQRPIGTTARKAIYVGHEDGVKGYLLYDLETRTTFTAVSVAFDEKASLDYIPEPLKMVKQVPEGILADKSTDVLKSLVTTNSNETEYSEQIDESEYDDQDEIFKSAEFDWSAVETEKPITRDETQEFILDELDEPMEDQLLAPTEAEQTGTEGTTHNDIEIDHQESNDVEIEHQENSDMEISEPDDAQEDTTRKSLRLKHKEPEMGPLTRFRKANKMTTLNDAPLLGTQPESDSGGSMDISKIFESDSQHNSNDDREDVMMPEEEIIMLMEFERNENDRDKQRDPVTMAEAMNGEDADRWIEAMNKEMGNIFTRGVIERARPEPGTRILKTKFHPQVKRNEKHEIVERKARFVVKGFMQVEGVDFVDAFAPTISSETVRLALTIAASRDWLIHQIDVSAAFLHADLIEEVWIQPPAEYEPNPELKWRLKKALYGLKQAPRAWYMKMSKTLKEMGFAQCPNEPCIYMRTKDADTIMMIVHVDDFLIMGTKEASIIGVKDQMRKILDIKDLGEARRFLNMVLKRDHMNKTITVSQTHIIEELENKYKDLEKFHTKIPFTDQSEDDDEPDDRSKETFLQIFGSLNYLCTWTRPDLAYAMSIHGQRLHNTSRGQLKSLIKTLYYVIGTADCKITLGNIKQQKLIGYTDADWGFDFNDRKSRSGVMILYHGSPIVWKSRKQSVVARSTAEAEYIAGSVGAREMQWIRQLLIFSGEEVTNPSRIYIDNQAVVKLTHSAASTKKVRHLELPYHELRQMVQDNIVEVEYVNTKDQLADSLTKPPNQRTLARLKDELRMSTKSELEGVL